jgi:hypothetical protein
MQHYCFPYSRSLCLIFILIWLIIESSTLVFYNHVISPTTGFVSCVSMDTIFQEYITFVQVIFKFLTVAPNTIVSVYTQSVGTSNNPVIAAQVQLISTIAIGLYYSYFSVNINRISSLNTFCLLFSVHFTYIFVHSNDSVNN